MNNDLNTIQFPQSSLIDANLLSQVFNNITNSYKFFWFKSIIDKTKIYIPNSFPNIKIKDIILYMIMQSYYMVNYCNLNLGYNDQLLEVNKHIYKTYSISPTLTIDELKNEFEKHNVSNDYQVMKHMNILKNYVPICFLSPYVNNCERFNQQSIEIINSIYNKNLIYFNNTLPYHFSYYKNNPLDTEIIIDSYYIDYFKKNYEFLNAFYKCNLIEYLQKRNPNVPGIINKLCPQLERNDISDINKFYENVITIAGTSINDIYTDEPLENLSNNILSIDHFVPWSYVANDEIWNLTPTSKSINSSKSNKLPNKKYISKLINQKWNIYKLIRSNKELQKYFLSKIKEKYIFTERIIKLFNFETNTLVSEDIFKSSYEDTIQTTYTQCYNSGFTNIF